MNKCTWHCCNKETKTKFCSINCKNKFHVDLKRKRLRIQALEYMGDKCLICGYDHCKDALEFHHIDPTEKDFGISAGGLTRSWEIIKPELDKCVCVCNRCHREIHSKMIDLSKYIKNGTLGRI